MYETKVTQPAGPCTMGAAEVSPVDGAANTIAYEQAVTAGLLGDLHSRLSAILRPVPPANEKADQLGHATHSQLHGKLNEFIYRQEGFNANLRSLLDRLTV